MKTRKAFTMIELIFVIVVLGILAAIAIPRLGATRDDAEIASNLKEIHTAISDFGGYYNSQASFGTINQMTSVNKFDAPLTDVSASGTVNFQTRGASGKENCISFAFASGGKLKITGNNGANGVVCKGILATPSFKTLDGSYVLGGIKVVN